jgi:hypothetical protein
VGLALCILASPHTIPTPRSTLFQTFMARVAKFGPSIPPPARGSAIPDRRLAANTGKHPDGES